jgi:hypothetical protein
VVAIEARFVRLRAGSANLIVALQGHASQETEERDPQETGEEEVAP